MAGVQYAMASMKCEEMNLSPVLHSIDDTMQAFKVSIVYTNKPNSWKIIGINIFLNGFLSYKNRSHVLSKSVISFVRITIRHKEEVKLLPFFSMKRIRHS